MIETLEPRVLFSHHPTPSPFPPLVGIYDGSATYANGVTQTFLLYISSQHGGGFAGTSQDFSQFTVSKITGAVTRRGAVHFRLNPVHFPGVVVAQGTVNAADTIITAAVRVRLGRQTAAGTFTLTLAQL